jgi:addiction module HigA family antidote
MTRPVPYPHPGEILSEEFLTPMGITKYRLAKSMGVSQRAIGEIVTGNRSITPSVGLRLSRFFGTSPAFWVGLQLDFDVASTGNEIGPELAEIVPIAAEAVPKPFAGLRTRRLAKLAAPRKAPALHKAVAKRITPAWRAKA